VTARGSASRLRSLPALLAGALLVATAVELARRLGRCGLDHNVGVYVCLAELARQGVVYPATATTDLLYCTLYQPLAFLPYALLPGSGLELIPWMRALIRVEALLGIAGVLLLLRRCGVDRVGMALAVGLLLGALPVASTMLTTGDDPRAGLFALLAWFVFAGRDGHLHPWRAAPLFAAALFTKLTAPLAAGIAALVAAGQARQPRAAVALLLGCALWAAAGYALAHGVLGWDLAGNGLRYAVLDPKPGRPLSDQVGCFLRDVVADPVTAVLLLGGTAAAAWRLARRRADALDAWFAAAVARAFAEYHSHGTELNHLLEPTLLGSVAVVRTLAPRLRPWHALLAVPAALLLGRPVLRLPCGDPGPIAGSAVAGMAALLRAQPPRPTLCEDPLLAWLSGSRPLVVDPFLAALAWRKHPEVRAAWFGAAGEPATVQRLVLLLDPEHDPRATHAYTHLHFDAEFLATVRRQFRVVVPSDFGTLLERRG
jgi:hypothetical protein